MKILGIGVDIVKNKRLKKSVKNKIFISRLFTLLEIKNSRLVKDKSIYFSKKFAAKESFSKALGTGFRKGLNFKDVEILNAKGGMPYLNISNIAKKLCLELISNGYSYKIHLSISDERHYAFAIVIIEGIKND